MNHPPKVPCPDEARRILGQAARKNPGRWAGHSLRVGEAARRLAEAHPRLDPQIGESLGLLHDVGRGEGPNGHRHMYEGHLLLSRLGYEDAARICLTHSFPAKDFSQLFGARDCAPEEERFIQSYVEACEYDDYDRLIMLCDSLAQASGFCLLEKRFVEVALRYAPTPISHVKWRACLELRDYFGRAIGRSVYDLLPGIVENTFSLSPTP